MKHLLSLLFCTVAVPLFVLGYQSYLDLIPVDKVPYVCKTFGSAGTNDYHYYNITEVGHEFCGYFSFDRNIFGQVSHNFLWLTNTASKYDCPLNFFWGQSVDLSPNSRH